jgi:hypothetical protein
LITVLITVVLWMLLKMTLFGGGAIRGGGRTKAGIGTKRGCGST